jgi:hypothetical protein
MHMIRKGQVRWVAKGDVIGQVGFINRLFGIAALRRRHEPFSLLPNFVLATHPQRRLRVVRPVSRDQAPQGRDPSPLFSGRLARGAKFDELKALSVELKPL